MHKESINLNEKHIVLQQLEIEPQQLQACAPSQHLLPAIFCYLPPSLSQNCRSPWFSFSNIFSSKCFSTSFMYPSNVSFLSFESITIYCTLTLRKFSCISTTFFSFFIYAFITVWGFFTLDNTYFMP